MRIQSRWTFALVLATAMPGFAQQVNQQDQPNTGWRRFGDSGSGPGQADAPPPSGPLAVPAGAWIAVRVDQPLSSDHNQPGDTFTATLAQPLVANGRILARRGQTVAGTVVEAQKAGHIRGTSSLRLELNELGLADGRQIQVKTNMMQRRGDTSVGSDAAAIGTSTAVGAAIGGAVDGGFGAGMGAIAGAAASTIGVLTTRGRATVVYPETMLTFRLEAPIVVDADYSLEAFQPVRQEDYEQTRLRRQGPPPRPNYYGNYPPYYAPYYPPYFYGPQIWFSTGRGRGYRRW